MPFRGAVENDMTRVAFTHLGGGAEMGLAQPFSRTIDQVSPSDSDLLAHRHDVGGGIGPLGERQRRRQILGPLIDVE